MHVLINQFGGIVPRHPEHLLNISQATIAHNVRLRHGKLEPWRERQAFAAATSSTKCFILHGCTPINFNKVVQAAMISPDYGRFFITGNGAPKAYYYENGTLKNCNLGVPAPRRAPVVSATETCSRSSDARSYVYTYVNQWGEESAPSPPSRSICVTDGATVQVTSIAPPPANYNITDINIYRSVTGMRDQQPQSQQFLSSYVYVSTIPATQIYYADTILTVNLGPVLETEKVVPPPAKLENIVSLEDLVVLAGSVCNRIYFSEPFLPYSWPVKYELTLDHPVLHMGAGQGRVYVTTDSIPYVINPPNCDDRPTASPVRIANTDLPDISLNYPHSAIVTPYGFIYSSIIGLICLRPDASYVVLTAPWFSPEDWAKVHPDTVRLGRYYNYLFCVTDEVSFILNIDLNMNADPKGTELSTISDKPIDMVNTDTGDLLMLEDGNITIWDKCVKYRTFIWESRELVGHNEKGLLLSGRTGTEARGVSWSPASAKVHTKDTKFTLKTPLQDNAYTRKVVDEEFFRLPRVGRNLWYKVRLEGISDVDFVYLSTDNFTLNSR